MKDYAICFRTIFNPDTCGVSIPGTFGIERLNIIIFGLKTSTLIPYTLYIAKNVDSEDERNAMYGILESYICLLYTSCKSPHKNVVKYCGQAGGIVKNDRQAR